MAAIWEISMVEEGAVFWLETGHRYVACSCTSDVVRLVERSTGLSGVAALRAAEEELADEATRRLADQEALPLRLAFHD